MRGGQLTAILFVVVGQTTISFFEKTIDKSVCLWYNMYVSKRKGD